LSRNLLHPLRYLVGRGAAAGHQRPPAGVVPRPEQQPALPQKILIIQPQFLQARPCHIRQLHFHFLRGTRRLTALRDVLDAAASRLDHLVVGAASFVNIAIAEAHGHIINQLRNLEAL